jgi:hypothetical protein
MGVRYKLRDDIVEFIKFKKREDPALSCRKLVGVIKRSFAMDVSKSSVNEVIKDYKLSGPVGRPARVKPPKNFSIPEDKKQQLMDNVKPFLSAESAVAPEAAPEARIETVAEIQPETFPEPAVSVPESVGSDAGAGEDSPPLLLRPDPVADAVSIFKVSDAEVHEELKALKRSSLPDIKPAEWQGDAGMPCGRLGAAALWFAFKAACSASGLGEPVARALGVLPDGIRNGDCAILLFAGLFAEHRPGFETDDWRTLCRLAGVSETQSRALLEQVISLDNNRHLRMVVGMEIAIAFTPACYLRWVTRQGVSFYVDMAFAGVHHTPPDLERPSSAWPLFMAVEQAVDRVITNRVPFVADIRGYGLTPFLCQLVDILNGSGGDELDRVEVLGLHGRRCAEFTALPRMRREFILQATLSDEELAKVEFDVIDNSRIFVDVLTGTLYGYYEGSLMLDGASGALLRVVSLKPAQGPNVVLLSNLNRNAVSAQELLACFFDRQGPVDTRDCSDGFTLPEVPGERLPVSRLFRAIDSHCQRFFLGAPDLSWDEMCRLLYDLPGRIKDRSEAMLIRLDPPPSFDARPRLAGFLRRLNGAGFKTADGRRVIFSLGALPSS